MALKPAIQLYEYQKGWVLDPSRFKEGRWSRQSGKSFACATGIVLDSRERERNTWTCLTSGERQVKEFMTKINLHAEITEKSIKWHEETYRYLHPDGYKDEYKVLECTLRNGSRIIGIPANPDTARGFSSNVYLDEFSVHKNSREIWAAVFPICSRGGYKLWITYTPKGKQNKAYEISNNEMFSHHVLDIYQAVAQGCPQNIDELKSAIDDEELWQQEYEVKFLDEATAYIPYDLINLVETDLAGKPELYIGGPCFAGVDIGRRRDLFVIWVAELLGDVLWTREIVELRGATFAAQDTELDRVMRQYNPLRVCMDQTGMGEKPVEDAQRRYGTSRVEGIIFSGPNKLTLASGFKHKFEDRRIRIPIDRKLRDDIHSIKKIATGTGNFRFDAERSENSHADRFWAGALMTNAASAPKSVTPIIMPLGIQRAAARVLGRYH